MQKLAKKFIQAVAREYGLSPQRITSRSKQRLLCDIRFAMWATLRCQTSMTYHEIAIAFHKADHGTIVHGVKQFYQLIDTGEEYRRILTRVVRVFCAVRREEEQ